MANSERNIDRKDKKRNFTHCEVEVLVRKVDTPKGMLFGGHSTGITNAKKLQSGSVWQMP